MNMIDDIFRRDNRELRGIFVCDQWEVAISTKGELVYGARNTGTSRHRCRIRSHDGFNGGLIDLLTGQGDFHEEVSFRKDADQLSTRAYDKDTPNLVPS